MQLGPLKLPLRFWLRLLMMALWVLGNLPIAYLSYRLRSPFHAYYVRLFSHGMNAIMGVKVVIKGTPEKSRPVLYVANHCSYLDIYALAAQLPAVFLAKDEIAGWPGIGWLARLSGVIYISRNPRKMKENLELVKQSSARSFILFPEGTTSDGNHVKKFNSSFFSLVDILSAGSAQPLAVQPVSLAYTRIANIPMGSHYRPYFSWFGAMDLAPHVREALSFASVTLEMTFHPLIEGEVLKNRKVLASECEERVRGSMTESLTHPRKKPADKALKIPAAA